MLIRNVDINGQMSDVRISGETLSAIETRLQPLDDETVIDGQGGALIPGLHDHHIHLNATAAAMNSVRCGPPEVNTEAGLLQALHGASGTDMLRGVGYHDSVAGAIDRAWLDAHGPSRPVRIQHRSGRMWILNGLAIEELGIDAPADGRLLDGDTLLRSSGAYPDLTPLIEKLLVWGVTGVTEVTPSNGLADLAHYQTHAKPLRLTVMGRPELAQSAASCVGPVKLHYHEYDLPALDALTAEVAAAHTSGRAVASHCVTRAELMLTLAAIEAAGPVRGDRIEHAAVADGPAMDWMQRLGVTVVTQPNFIAERAEAYRRDVEPSDHPHLWRLRSFGDRDLACAAGSDAPFGDPNPWAAMAAAVKRPDGFGQNETVSPDMALALYTKPASAAYAASRRLEVGAVADMCLLDRSWAAAGRNFADVQVRATWIGGEAVYSTIASTSPQSSAV